MAQLNEQQLQAIQTAISAGRKIEAIRLYREAVPGSGLAEAKEWVEKFEEQWRASHPDAGAMLPKKSGCMGMLAAIAFALVVAGLLAFI